MKPKVQNANIYSMLTMLSARIAHLITKSKIIEWAIVFGATGSSTRGSVSLSQVQFSSVYTVQLSRMRNQPIQKLSVRWLNLEYMDGTKNFVVPRHACCSIASVQRSTTPRSAVVFDWTCRFQITTVQSAVLFSPSGNCPI